MKINWKLRLQNKVTLTALIVAVITFVYAVLAILGIVPSLTEHDALNLAYVVLDAIFAVGIITDPSTVGVSDSKQAMEYDEPRNDGPGYQDPPADFEE